MGVNAAYWSADRAVCQLSCGCPLLLLGDALCGKPFYTGSTLNRHFWDVAALIDEVEWTHDGQSWSNERFEAHDGRYQTAIRRIAEFHRRGDARVPLPLQSSSPASPAFQSRDVQEPASRPCP